MKSGYRGQEDKVPTRDFEPIGWDSFVVKNVRHIKGGVSILLLDTTNMMEDWIEYKDWNKEKARFLSEYYKTPDSEIDDAHRDYREFLTLECNDINFIFASDYAENLVIDLGYMDDDYYEEQEDCSDICWSMSFDVYDDTNGYYASSADDCIYRARAINRDLYFFRLNSRFNRQAGTAIIECTLGDNSYVIVDDIYVDLFLSRVSDVYTNSIESYCYVLNTVFEGIYFPYDIDYRSEKGMVIRELLKPLMDTIQYLVSREGEYSLDITEEEYEEVRDSLKPILRYSYDNEVSYLDKFKGYLKEHGWK